MAVVLEFSMVLKKELGTAAGLDANSEKMSEWWATAKALMMVR